MADDVTISGGYPVDRHGRLNPLRTPFLFWQHDVAVTIPNDTWTPLPWNVNRVQTGDWSDWPSAAATTIAAGSNGQALPQGTINVASTAGFTSTGYLVVRISSTDRVVRYTELTATTFTGCTLGVGTMTTGDQVRQAQVCFGVTGTLMAAIAEVAWASNATGLRGIRFRVMDGGFNLQLATTVIGAVAATEPKLHIQTAEQPAQTPALPVSPLIGNVVEAYQSSGGDLTSVGDVLAAPRLVAYVSGKYLD
jgi:hypothetical protein